MKENAVVSTTRRNGWDRVGWWRAGLFSLLAAGMLGNVGVAWGGEGTSDPESDRKSGFEFFEKHIRPVLVQQCQECHSDSIQAKGGLRLDVAVGLRLGGQRGETIVSGHPEKSLLISALKYERLRMPPGEKLDDETIARFEEWVRMGAPDPRELPEEKLFHPRDIDWEQERKHWAFQPVQNPAAPEVADSSWPYKDLDRFVLSKLESKKLAPAADAPREAWLRRVTLDLTGLPPTAGELLDFELDRSPDAREKVVNRLLSVPQFGERWGRHWLDLSRYGESTGKERNFVYLQAWRYRDYVIDSFNQDKSIDQFIREQLAGDLLPARDAAHRDELQIATGFLALNPKGINDRNRESFLLEIVDEQIESVGRGLMGLTVVCARCHDHKYDPIAQSDYYALAGILRSSEPKFGILNRTRAASVPDQLIPLTSNEVRRGLAAADGLMAELKARDEALQKKSGEARRRRDALPPPPKVSVEVVAKADVVRSTGSDGAATISANVRPETEPASEEERQVRQLESEVKEETKAVEALRKEVVNNVSLTMAIGIQDRSEAADLAIRIRGEVDKLGPTVRRGFLRILGEGRTLPGDVVGSGRLQLAEWVVSEDNPLTARVFVNRAWTRLLGRGIVKTQDDFGFQSEAPTHLELLDFLTKQFIANGWSTKQLVREIVLSRTYQLGTLAAPENAIADPENTLFWRWNRRRLDAESIRDSVLAVSGDLDLRRPYGTPLLALGVRELGPETDYGVVHRPSRLRSVYLPYLRGQAPEMLAVFDAADPGLTVGKRDVTSGPDQALHLLNSPLLLETSQRLAARVLDAGVESEEARVVLAFRTVLGVNPTPNQRDEALRAIAEIEPLKTVGEAALPTDQARLAAWSRFCQTLILLPQFRYVF